MEVKKVPSVSVIIPAHNCAEYLPQCVDSVLSQTFQDFEIIIVDDGSTDHTKDLIQNTYAQEKRLKYLYQQNSGPGAARNAGLQLAAGRFIAFLDADDYYHPDNLQMKVDVLGHDLDSGWVFSDCVFVDTEGNKICLSSNYPDFRKAYQHVSRGRNDRKGLFQLLLQEGNFISTPTIMLRKSCLDEIGHFDAEQLLHQDYKQWLLLSERFLCHYLDQPLAFITKRPASAGMVTRRSLEQRLRLYDFIEQTYGRELAPMMFAWRRRYADALNRLGVIAMQEGDTAGARRLFWASIKKCPYQGFAYRAWLRA